MSDGTGLELLTLATLATLEELDLDGRVERAEELGPMVARRRLLRKERVADCEDLRDDELAEDEVEGRDCMLELICGCSNE